MALIAENDVLLLRAALEDIKHPVQSALLALGAHVRPDIATVDNRRLGDHSDQLVRVFLNMLLGARPDDVQFQVGLVLRVIVGAGGGCEVPAVDVIVAQVVYPRNRSMKGLEDMSGLRREGCTFGDEDALLSVNLAEDDHAAAVLVCQC